MKPSGLASASILFGLALSKSTISIPSRPRQTYPYMPVSIDLSSPHAPLGDVVIGAHIVGAMMTEGNYSHISGTFTVPTPAVPPGGKASNMYCVRVELRMCSDCISGPVYTIGSSSCTENGSYMFSLYYENGTLHPYASASDEIRITVDAYAGNFTVENLSLGENTSKVFVNNPHRSLTMSRVVWGMELPFESETADFGTVQFGDFSAVRYSKLVDLNGSKPLRLLFNNSNPQFTIAPTITDHSMTIKYPVK
ncbi:hypothetical protein BGW36DRAFT_427787 [Talaromyces proteolyticus]|uniref:Uncharacterized protein n=1 Tax=Talaromyces proteolyticus TaxID=1131652 RepID=A0AAD4KTB8_9EURO|nr:uncharacterized protein BGW36DRAFT_427787 [Talaromyces proteolyticus]KAH8697842.1 hypothetical protein BGW36DRAFT_427787 [Talaromyces proteolyticus]